MRKILSCVTALSIAAGASVGHAQRAPSIFDLGVFAGGAYSSDWFEIADEGYGIGFTPAFGGVATFWATPTVGVRLHTSYFPSELPEVDGEPFDDPGVAGDGDYHVNNYLYDLGLVARPWTSSANRWLSSTYAFVGAGGMTTDLASTNDPGEVNCVGPYGTAPVCLSDEPEFATVGQGTVGLGVDLFPITQNIGLFAEWGLHGYDSPVHVYTEDETVAEDKFSWTNRLVGGIKLSLGGVQEEVVVVAPVAPVAPRPAPQPAAPETRRIQVCVLANGELQNVDAMFRPATRDTVVTRNGSNVPFRNVYSDAGYATNQSWFVNQEKVTVGTKNYVRFGVTRAIQANELRRMGEFRGVPLFEAVAQSAPSAPQVIYVPVRQGCEFQPFQVEEEVRRVCG